MSDQADGLRRLVRSRIDRTGTATTAPGLSTMRAASGRIESRAQMLLSLMTMTISVRWGRGFRSIRKPGVKSADYSA